MYNFIDVTEVSDGFVLPSEAMKLNGEYLENLIDGYRTLHVSGREALSPELETYETGVRDGSKLKSRRYPARTIIVTYQLIAESNEAFRRAYNKLGGLLNLEDAKLIFNDEPDKFFIGTPSFVGEVEPGANSVIGEFEILCTDPFKYSVIEYEASSEGSGSKFFLDYHGTYKSYPTFEVDFYKESEVSDDGTTAGQLTGKGDCGFVAFYNADAKIIQIGDPNEVDGTDKYEKSQTLIHQIFENNTTFSGAAAAPWTLNAGTVLQGMVQTGTVGIGVASYTEASDPAPTSGTLLDTTSDDGAPAFHYTVAANTSGRTATTVDVTVTITAALTRESSYFGNGYGLTASVYMGGSWHNTTLKTTSEWWENTTIHTAHSSFTVSGLTAAATALTGIRFKVSRSDDAGGSAGILAETSCSNLSISAYQEKTPQTYHLTATDFGTAPGEYHGPSITRTIPADQSGVSGAANFTLTYRQNMCMGNGDDAAYQIGGFQVCLLDSSNTVVAGVRIIKHVYGSNVASLRFFVNGKSLGDPIDIDLTYYNEYFGAGASSVKTSSITKNGNSINFKIGGYSKGCVFRNDAIQNVEVKKITFAFETYGSNNPLSYNGLTSVKFVKHNCDTWQEVPNKFSANDVLIVDCKDGNIYLNGICSPELGALGNDWESFSLKPGQNPIGFAYSDWVPDGYAPRFKVRYREAFL